MSVKLHVLPDSIAICRLAPDADVPTWATGDFVSITRTTEELSIVCPQGGVPDDVTAERDYRCLRIAGTLDFTMVGVISGIARVLAENEVTLLVVSTYDTDWFLFRQASLDRAVGALRAAGYEVA